LQIWQLADLNKDGKLDKWEFSIAMKLVRNALSGHQMPSQLPDSMRQLTHPMPPMSFRAPFPGRAGSMSATQTPTAAGYGVGGGPQPLYTPQAGHPPPAMRPMSAYGSQQFYSGGGGGVGGGSAAQFTMGTKELGDWTIPQHMKLRFSQHFNQLDRQRVGLLTGQQARGVLGESQLPTPLLAQIWTMSDVNKDGFLSIEEFCVAMFLIERAKEGYQLPSALPQELSGFCNRCKTASPQMQVGVG